MLQFVEYRKQAQVLIRNVGEAILRLPRAAISVH